MKAVSLYSPRISNGRCHGRFLFCLDLIHFHKRYAETKAATAKVEKCSNLIKSSSIVFKPKPPAYPAPTISAIVNTAERQSDKMNFKTGILVMPAAMNNCDRRPKTCLPKRITSMPLLRYLSSSTANFSGDTIRLNLGCVKTILPYLRPME